MADWQHPTLDAAIRPVRGHVALVVVLRLLATALEGFGIGMLAPLISAVTGAGGGVALPGPFAPYAQGLTPAARAGLIGCAILALITAKNLVVLANGVLQAWIYGHAGQAIREDLIRALMAADPAFCLTAPSSRLLNVLSNESWRAADAVAAKLSLTVHVAATVILAVFLFALSPVLTVVVTAGLLSMHLVQELLISTQK